MSQRPDAETRALSSSPVFQALIAEARASAVDAATVPLDDREHRTDEREFAEAYSRALDLLETSQGAEVTDQQGRTLRAVLTALDYVRGRGTVEQLAREAGVPVRSVRVIAAALSAASVGARPLAHTG